MARSKEMIPGMIERHRTINPDLIHWFRRPATVRILMYAEGSVRFEGGSFDGLQRVIAALAADPWPWVKFEVTTIHRGTDPSADHENKTLDEVNLENYDELWLFGISSGNLLDTAELNAVHEFMDAGGGVLHTGDHASLGEGIAGSIKRAGKMREYPAPAAASGVWNSTLRHGGDGNYQFSDQSDDTPQDISLRWYPAWSFSPWIRMRRYPHAVLCGPNGPIKVFPDHQHEGEAIAPDPSPASEWPSKGGFQPKAEVVAWGHIEDPSADVGRKVGLVSVYDGHRADVGRIVADSTWHHWFDINLDGFTASASGLDHLAEIEQYFMNVAAWLAPERKQSQMRNGVFLIAAWRDPLIMLDPTSLHPFVLGGLAIDALGQYAPQCLVRGWIFDLIPRKIDLWRFRPFDGPIPEFRIPLPIEELVMAELVSPLLSGNIEQVVPPGKVDLDAIGKSIDSSARKVANSIKQMTDVLNPVVSEVEGMLKR